MRQQTFKVLLITLISFGLYYLLENFYFRTLYNYLCDVINIKVIAYFLTYIIVGLPLLIGLFFTHKPKDIFYCIGISNGFFKGFFFAFLFTLPMLIGYSIVFKFNSSITFNKILGEAVFAAFFEELYFRGVLFGQLFRFTKIGFIPSVLLCAVVFALSHLWQSTAPLVIVGIFMTTFLGAIFFAWLYIEWDRNLWIPIGMHLFMNLHWMLFSAGDNAFGSTYANIFRSITIALTIVGTLYYKKRIGKKLRINQNNLWINKTSANNA
jgi:uncharacterized protein